MESEKVNIPQLTFSTPLPKSKSSLIKTMPDFQCWLTDSGGAEGAGPRQQVGEGVQKGALGAHGFPFNTVVRP